MSAPTTDEWSDEEQAAYRKWLFAGPEGDLDTSAEGWLSDLQERAFHGGYLAAPVGKPVVPTEETLGKIIWETSRADEGTISVTGANIVARALLASDLLT